MNWRSASRPFAFIAFALACMTGWTTNVVHSVDRLAPDFIRVSLLWIGPGTDFFACAGHASLRLECPTYGLDYCFSCESEPIGQNPVRFVMGRLKTGLFAIPTKDFLKTYTKEGRGCRQYVLTLPPDVKQRLWKILDGQVSAGRSLPYDYVKYCCVQTMLQPLLEAIRPRQLNVAPWPDIYRLSRREVLANDLAWCPWTRFALHTIAGTEVDRKVDEFKSVILSRDLVELLRGATIDGVPVLTGDGEILLPYRPLPSAPVLTPVVIGGMLLCLSILYLFWSSRLIAGLFLFLQTAIGILILHLVVASTLPATDWNWLIVPFNLLPVVFWKCRHRWALAFCFILAAWEAYMLANPHQMTDPAYYLVVAAYFFFYLAEVRDRRHIRS